MEIEIFSLPMLGKIIVADKESNKRNDNRFPIRFIFLNSFEELQKVVIFLSKRLGVKKIELSDFLTVEKSWLTPEEISEYIKGIRTDTVVVPLSELLRFQSKEDFYTLLKALTEIEVSRGKIRIYIPLVGLWERFKKEFWEKFYRKEEWAPIWKVKSDVNSRITIYQLTFNISNINIFNNLQVISSTKDWFNIWKRKGIKKVLSVNRALGYYYKNFLPDQVFEVKVISNLKELLEVFFSFEIPVEFKKDEEKFWNKLLTEVIKAKSNSLGDVFLKHFNVRDLEKLNVLNFLQLYLNSEDDYERWILKNTILSLSDISSTYFGICLKKLNCLRKESLIETLWLRIFNISNEELKETFFSERKELLRTIYKTWKFPIEYIEDKLSKNLESIGHLPTKEKLKYVTDITQVERKYIIRTVAENAEEILPEIKEVYRELYYYLDWNLIKPDNDVEEWIIEYFRNYNLSKVKHQKLDKIESILNSKNQDKEAFSKWFYSIDRISIRSNYNYIWIDAVGAEWFPLLVHLLSEIGEEKNIIVRSKTIVRVSLPTTTKCNKYSIPKIEDLDNYIHSKQSYTYPDDLVKEIEVIKHVVEKILNKVQKTTIIVSDHGFSFLCTKEFGNSKVLNFKGSDHEGRCMYIKEGNYHDDSYFMVWNVDEGECKNNRYLIALKHKSLNNLPRREVHGGATPEEVLVPCITLERETEEIEYKITPQKFFTEISKPLIEFKVEPQPLVIPRALSKDKEFNLSFDNKKNVYILDLKALEVGQHSIDVKIGKKVYTLEVTIKGGFKERDLL